MSGAVKSRIRPESGSRGKTKNKILNGNERGDDQLRQVLAEIGVQRLDPFHRRVDQFAGAFAARIGRAEPQDFIEQALAQVAFDAHRQRHWR